MTYKCSQYEIWVYSSTETCMVVYSVEAFKAMQRLFHRYPAGIEMEVGEEPVFRFDTIDLKRAFRSFTNRNIQTPYSSSERSRKPQNVYTTEGLIRSETPNSGVSEGSGTSNG